MENKNEELQKIVDSKKRLEELYVILEKEKETEDNKKKLKEIKFALDDIEKIFKELNSNSNQLNSRIDHYNSIASKYKELYNIKKEQTNSNVKSIDVLEKIILNPDVKISDIIKSEYDEYNGIELELLIALSQFLLNKDKAIQKTKDKGFETILLSVLTEYKTCPEYRKSFTDNVNLTRNNIGHGKFTLDKENMEIVFDDSGRRISYKNIKELIENNFVDNNKKINKLPIKIGFLEKTTDSKININNSIETLDHFEIHEFNIYNIKKDYNVTSLNSVINKINDLKVNPNNIQNVLNGIEIASNFSGIKVDYTNKKMSELDIITINKINSIISVNYEKLKDKDDKILETFLNGCINDLYFDPNSSLQLDKALSQIRKLALYSHEYKDQTYNEIKNNKKDLPPTNNQMLVATTLVKFNMLYSYNNDTIFKSNLDFSKIDLSIFKPKINADLNTSFSTYGEINKSIYQSIETENTKYEKSKEYSTIKEEKYKLNKFKLYSRLFMIADNNEIMVLEKTDFKKNIVDEEKYVENKNILAHIRNSIIHGNIIINTRLQNNDLKTCSITFEDYCNDEKTFELTTTLDKIALLNNCEEIFKMVDTTELYNKDNIENVNLKSYTGFTSLLSLIAIVSIESLALLFYFFLKIGFF